MLRATRLEPTLLGALLVSLLFPPPPTRPAPLQNSIPAVSARQAGPGAPSAAAQPLQRSCVGTVLRMLPGVIPAGVALLLVSQPLQPQVQAASSQLPPLHLFALLTLVCIALAEHHAHHRGALPLPEWLHHSIPGLSIQVAQSCAAPDGAQATGVGSSDALRLTLDLLSLNSEFIEGLVGAAGAAVQQLCSQASQDQPASQALAQYSSILSLVSASLRHAPVHSLLLELRGSSSQAAQTHSIQGHLCEGLQLLLREDQLPAVIASDPGCMSELRRLRVVAEDLVPELAK
jgi:hypothetical protein